MSEIKIITLASLLDALVDLQIQAKAGTLTDVIIDGVVIDFKAYCEQPAEADQAKIMELQATIDEQETSLLSAAQWQQDATATILELKGMLSTSQNQKAVASVKPVVDIDGVQYQINHGAAPHSVQDLQDDPDLIKELLKIEGQNAITAL